MKNSQKYLKNPHYNTNSDTFYNGKVIYEISQTFYNYFKKHPLIPVEDIESVFRNLMIPYDKEALISLIPNYQTGRLFNDTKDIYFEIFIIGASLISKYDYEKRKQIKINLINILNSKGSLNRILAESKFYS